LFHEKCSSILRTRTWWQTSKLFVMYELLPSIVSSAKFSHFILDLTNHCRFAGMMCERSTTKDPHFFFIEFLIMAALGNYCFWLDNFKNKFPSETTLPIFVMMFGRSYLFLISTMQKKISETTKGAKRD
jgi:hypothetical protein